MHNASRLGLRRCWCGGLATSVLLQCRVLRPSGAPLVVRRRHFQDERPSSRRGAVVGRGWRREEWIVGRRHRMTKWFLELPIWERLRESRPRSSATSRRSDWPSGSLHALTDERRRGEAAAAVGRPVVRSFVRSPTHNRC